ncbi:glycoside hydrolase family 3 protein [Providencia sp. CRE-3FA-0001]|uniref:beta-N-acetylhexosaminidase n=2 Tax=Gammaproteobacteria TaxID=1236 RepID=A0AA42JZ99_9GAMM|nr:MULTISPECIES: glycoside hydrolase family 3 protein [Providencia]EJD6411324.1 glycoside hydrolase family 3 protein [Providencia rettgeri]EJD6664129.1 glycoside hydrolase family 3 protein [Providencia rettgeri]ELR5078903.1 glycoside hydrolase family 3 protein [Providencia rettgeri]ELR5174163.1 glycoside hydrolase family 3 protein [Providencia rettgeri]ELR5197007.1 glycoside hydrolase family 3 protein [Providencia rettgeri]
MKKLTLLAACLFSAWSIADPMTQAQLNDLWKNKQKSAEEIVNNMSEAEKIGQLFMLDFRYWNNDSNGDPAPFLAMNDEVSKVINQYHLGSVILFRENLIDTPQTVELINQLQSSRSNLPLFIGTDQEGGYVTRLRVGTEMPGNMALGATRNPALAELTGMIHGYELSSLGFNINFGPVVDINNNQNNPVIGVRSYSDDKNLVETLSTSYIKGIHKYNLLTSIKHFPGHGNVSADSHVDLPVVNSDTKTWHSTELAPFKYALAHGADAVMTAHIIVPALDDHKITTLAGKKVGTPATLSKPILHGILRDELKYDGLIITDAMDMGAIADNFDTNWAVETSLLAGSDIVLMPIKMWDTEAITRLDNMYRYLETQAAKNPELKKRIDESAKRVVLKKLQQEITAQPINLTEAKQIVASKSHKDLENMVSEQAITLIKNDNILPYQLKPQNRILVISDEKPRNALIQKQLSDIAEETDVIINSSDNVIKLNENTLSKSEARDIVKKQDLILLTTYNLKDTPTNAQLIIDAANNANIPLVVISSRNPYDIAYLNDVKANIAIYGITGFDVTNNNRNSLETNIRSGLRTLFANRAAQPLNPPQGLLPVNIKNPQGDKILFPYGHGENYHTTY